MDISVKSFLFFNEKNHPKTLLLWEQDLLEQNISIYYKFS